MTLTLVEQDAYGSYSNLLNAISGVCFVGAGLTYSAIFGLVLTLHKLRHQALMLTSPQSRPGQHRVNVLVILPIHRWSGHPHHCSNPACVVFEARKLSFLHSKALGIFPWRRGVWGLRIGDHRDRLTCRHSVEPTVQR
jgi:hypothetical protein